MPQFQRLTTFDVIPLGQLKRIANDNTKIELSNPTYVPNRENDFISTNAIKMEIHKYTVCICFDKRYY